MFARKLNENYCTTTEAVGAPRGVLGEGVLGEGVLGEEVLGQGVPGGPVPPPHILSNSSNLSKVKNNHGNQNILVMTFLTFQPCQTKIDLFSNTDILGNLCKQFLDFGGTLSEKRHAVIAVGILM